MSYTTPANVRRHLSRLNLNAGSVRNQILILTSADYDYLPHRNIVSGSEKVKSIENDTPTSVAVTFTADEVNLGQANIVSQSIVCASDSSLKDIYQENTDYAVDYESGIIRRLAGGDISSGAAIITWFLHYHIYQSGQDYVIDTVNGRIKRLSGGSIEEGQEVLIDFEVGSAEFSDEEIEQVILEAESEISHAIDETYRESTDPALQTAATTLALAYLCRNAAAAGDNNRTAEDWMLMASSYETTARRLMKFFNASGASLNYPRLT